MIIYNGVNSFTAFDLYVASRELPAPKRKEITETVPYMSGEWDFSYHDGNIDEYETLKIKYTFDVIADTKQELHEQRKKLLAWVHSRGDQKLVDTDISYVQYYEVYKAQGDWQGNDLQGLLTVEFSCYPFAKTDKRVSQILSNTATTMTIENEGREAVPTIRVASKNLFDISKISVGEPYTQYNYFSAVTENSVTISSQSGYSGNGFRTTLLSLKTLCPDIEVGKTYTVNAQSDAHNQMIYLSGANVSWFYGTSLLITEEMTESTVCLYGYSSTHDGFGDCIVSNIQIERGEKATEYTPYIASEDLIATINYGANTLTIGAGSSTNKIALETGENTFTVNGTGELTFEFAEESY